MAGSGMRIADGGKRVASTSPIAGQTPTLFGWLFDVYPCDDGMQVWILDEDGRAHALRDSFTPSFYVRGPASELRAVGEMLRSRRAPVTLRRAERKDLFVGREVEVLEVGVRRPGLLPALVRQTTDFRPDLTYYDADIPLPQRYVLARGAFPLAYCAVEHRAGRIHRLQALDTPWEIDYRLPPLRVMTMRLDGELRDPAHSPGSYGAHGPGSHGAAQRGDLLIEVDGREFGFPRAGGRELVLGVRQLLERYDPDLLLSAYGDSYLLPRLLALARHYRIDLPLNRDRAQAVAHKPAHSYFSYGRIVFRDEQHLLFGRWHIDRQNAFLAGDYGVDGTLEIARLCGLPVQTVSRVSTGTGISAMQVATALRRGVLVPWQKRHPESLKTGLDLIVADKGGLVYTPIAGLHEHVAELDFTAMYPSIMVHFNISPETVGPCRCEEEGAGERHAPEGGIRDPGSYGIGDTLVPELGTPVCRHRVGLVPETLAPLLEKRARYKARMRELPEGDRMREIYRRRYSAHKWLLVTCFGYLGYKNARFGRIEAHESVTAYGREVLLRAKEWVEGRGFRVLHLFVDGLWIYRPGSRERPDYETLIEELCRETGLHIGLEGIYRWVAFLPSRVDPRSSVPNRYFGAFEDGEIKVRGIEARRHDTPAYIEDTQRGMLAILARGEDAAGFRRCLPEAIDYARERLQRLRAGRVPLAELVVRHNLSRKLEEFVVRTAAARAAAELAHAQVELSPGEAVRFVYTPGPEKARAWDLIEGEIPYDREVYTELLARAVQTMVMALGVDRATVDTWLLGGTGYWGPPGALPPAGADLRAPLLNEKRGDGAFVRRIRWLRARLPGGGTPASGLQLPPSGSQLPTPGRRPPSSSSRFPAWPPGLTGVSGSQSSGLPSPSPDS
jgi:DNA polymerase-2